MLTEEQRAENRRRGLVAEANAKKLLKSGDRLRVTKCPGTKRWITFAEWDGHWIVSKSGIDDYSPLCVDMLNGEAVDLTKTPNDKAQGEAQGSSRLSPGATGSAAGDNGERA